MLENLYKVMHGKQAAGTSLYDRYRMYMHEMQAESVKLATAEEYPALHAMVAEAAERMQTKLPQKVIIAESEQPLVRMLFNDTLAISRNAIDIHTPEELQTRIAHSLVHQKDKWRDFGTVVAANVGAEVALEQFVMRFTPGLNKLRKYLPLEPAEIIGESVIHAGKGVFSGEPFKPMAAVNNELGRIKETYVDQLGKDKVGWARDVAITIGAVMAVEELAGYVSAEHSQKTYLQADVESVQRGLNATTLREALEKVQLREEEIKRLDASEHKDRLPGAVRRILDKREDLRCERPKFTERIALLRKLEAAQQEEIGRG